MVATRTISVADVQRMGADGDDFELVDGVLLEQEIMGGRHGEIGAEVLGPLYVFNRAAALGRLYTSDTGFVMDHATGTVLKPDVAFVRTERLPRPERRIGFMPISPDLVVEVVSPSNRPVDIAWKVERYQRAGVL